MAASRAAAWSAVAFSRATTAWSFCASLASYCLRVASTSGAASDSVSLISAPHLGQALVVSTAMAALSPELGGLRITRVEVRIKLQGHGHLSAHADGPWT